LHKYVRALAGIVLKRTFREGGDVKAGEVLFRIDPAPFKASYDSAQAALAKAEANLTQASLKAQRYKPLVEVNAVSKQEYDDAVSTQKQAEADVASAKAARETASHQSRLCHRYLADFRSYRTGVGH